MTNAQLEPIAIQIQPKMATRKFHGDSLRSMQLQGQHHVLPVRKPQYRFQALKSATISASAASEP